MAVKAGYKQTEVGVIPEDWEVVSLKQITLDMLQGVNTAIDVPEYVEDGIPMLKANNVIDQVVNFKSPDFISLKTYEGYSERYKLKKNDFLFSNIGARLGTGSLLEVDVSCSFAWNVMRIVPDQNKVIPKFLAFQVNSPKNSSKIKSEQSGSGMGFIPKSIMKNVRVAIAPLPEQRAIATALSDADALIESLEQLIHKKRQIKQGAMQELLTGKKRLRGFSGEWGVKRLGEVASIQRGASPRPIDSPIWFDNNSEIGWVRISDVTSAVMFLKETTQRLSELGIQQSRRVRRGSLIMSICATVGRPVITEIDTCIHDGFVVFDNLSVQQIYLYYFLKFIESDWSKHGQTGSQMNLNTPLINRTEILVPSAQEQAAIATILSDMDTELAALEEKLGKAISVKQGMMQELLMGRVRLV